jgi:glycolate oxidase
MKLSTEAYRALEDIVGTDNISEDPAILDSYAYQMGNEVTVTPGSRFMARPVAVMMPGSTEEVQSIIKTCNRYRLKYKAYSTGWGFWGGCQTEGIIKLDLRRMGRILEIDEENLFAVVEPYVVAAQLQAEAMKRGLNCHMTGAGASHSCLAAATSFQGNGPDTLSMGFSGENVLGMEWVMPTGEILRTGSLGSGAGWFCGEGPGPSVRGLCRGNVGAAGGMGVYTKCALRLDPWPGPPVMPAEGTAPAYRSPLPDNFRAYTLTFPTWQAYADCYYKIYDADIGYILHSQFNKFGEDLQAAMVKIISDHTRHLDDLEDLAGDPEVQKLNNELKRSFQIVLAGMTPRDIEYQEEVLEEILRETRGRKVAAMSDREMEKYVLMYLIKLPYKNLNFVYAGGYTTCFTHKGPPDFVVGYVPHAMELLKRHQQSGLIVDCGANSMMGASAFMGGGGVAWFEQFMFHDPHVKESMKEGVAVVVDSGKFSREHHWPSTYEGVFGTEEQKKNQMLASNQPEVYRWQRKIKEAFDPNEGGDGNYAFLADQ